MLPEHRGSMSVTSHLITASSPSRVDMQVMWYGTCMHVGLYCNILHTYIGIM